MSLFNKVGFVMAVAGVTTLAAACTVKTDDTPAGPLYPDQASFCTALATAVCTTAVVEDCYSVTGDVAAETDTCIATYSVASVCNPSGHVYHHEGSENAIAVAGTVFASGKPTRADLDTFEQARAAVFNGGGGVGSSCTGTVDCNVAEGLSCVPSVSGNSTCAVAEEVGPGLECGGASQVCADGFYCNADSSACTVLPAPGKECTVANACDSKGVCDTTLRVPVCAAKTASGQDCSAGEQCEDGICNKTSGQDTGTCGGFVSLYPDAEACESFKP